MKGDTKKEKPSELQKWVIQEGYWFLATLGSNQMRM